MAEDELNVGMYLTVADLPDEFAGSEWPETIRCRAAAGLIVQKSHVVVQKFVVIEADFEITLKQPVLMAARTWEALFIPSEFDRKTRTDSDNNNQISDRWLIPLGNGLTFHS